jgi:hypothetical protein
MVPSIHSIRFDDDEYNKSEPENLCIRKTTAAAARPCPPLLLNDAGLSARLNRETIIRKNPLYPVTMPLIQRLVAEDMLQFGRLPRLRCPDLPHLTAIASSASLPASSPSVSPALSPLSEGVSGRAAGAPSPVSSSSLAAMANSSLPPRKRRLLPAEAEETDAGGQRGSVIQFGIRA